MGSVFGKINEEMPEHVVVYKGDGFEVWRYPTSVAAVVTAESLDSENPPTGDKFANKAFWALAGYIGVLSKPANTKTADNDGEKIAMTSPVVMTPPPVQEAESEKISMTSPVVMTPPPAEKIAMTAPVVMGPPSTGESMAFILPSKYSTVEETPVPTNPAVKIQLMPVRFEAVLQFNGNLNMKNPERIERKADELLESMKKDDIQPTGPYTIQGYNAPFVIPWLKRNEVHFPVEDNPKFEYLTALLSNSNMPHL